MNRKSALLAVSASLALVTTAHADEVLVNADITTSTTWTANNTYNLTKQIYVRNGATLTIEAGTVVASDVTVNGSGSLAVTRTGQINVQGTPSNPVIMTSKSDVATWVNGNPKTGTWREAANEWGNLTLMGSGYISEDGVAGNSAAPSPTNTGVMEGLVAEGPGGQANVMYGGGDDDHDTGTITYLSIRYGGRVIGLANELNGMSIGGVGQDTDIHHVEIMNNVDDGFEIWGGKVNLKHWSVWNVGDDSFDVDQGWRGKAQFGLIVQGYSLDQVQGSGVGDNCFEVDGAENSDWQPVTTAVVYNTTVVGQPLPGAGDYGTAWRDGARVQYRNMVFMDLGDELIRNDGSDGDGGSGYGFNGTLPFHHATNPDIWDTAFSVTSPVNPFDPLSGYGPAQAYTAQVDGFLAEMRDSVFFRMGLANNTAFTTADLVGVVDVVGTGVGDVIPLDDNVWAGNDVSNMPIAGIVRAAPVSKGGKSMIQVVGLDPRAANAATDAVATAPADGFFTAADYRGGFGPSENWLVPWSASYAFGFLDNVALSSKRTDPLNLGTLDVDSLPTLGNSGFGFVIHNPAGTCGATAGTFAFVAIDDAQANFLFPDWGCAFASPSKVLIGFTPFKTVVGLYTGAPTEINLGGGGIPNDPSFVGINFSAQGGWLTPAGLRLGQAVDCTVGYGA